MFLQVLWACTYLIDVIRYESWLTSNWGHCLDHPQFCLSVQEKIILYQNIKCIFYLLASFLKCKLCLFLQRNHSLFKEWVWLVHTTFYIVERCVTADIFKISRAPQSNNWKHSVCERWYIYFRLRNEPSYPSTKFSKSKKSNPGVWPKRQTYSNPMTILCRWFNSSCLSFQNMR